MGDGGHVQVAVLVGVVPTAGGGDGRGGREGGPRHLKIRRFT